MKLEFTRWIFEKSSNVIFNDSPSIGRGIPLDGRTDMTKLIVAFRNCRNSLKTFSFSNESSWRYKQSKIIYLTFNNAVCSCSGLQHLTPTRCHTLLVSLDGILCSLSFSSPKERKSTHYVRINLVSSQTAIIILWNMLSVPFTLSRDSMYGTSNQKFNDYSDMSPITH